MGKKISLRSILLDHIDFSLSLLTLFYLAFLLLISLDHLYKYLIDCYVLVFYYHYRLLLFVIRILLLFV